MSAWFGEFKFSKVNQVVHLQNIVTPKTITDEDFQLLLDQVSGVEIQSPEPLETHHYIEQIDEMAEKTGKRIEDFSDHFEYWKTNVKYKESLHDPAKSALDMYGSFPRYIPWV